MPGLVLFVSSAVAAGAKNMSADGSSFDIQFDTPLQMSSGTPTIRCLQATLFYSFPNITSDNNGLHISWTTGTGLNVTSFSYQIRTQRTKDHYLQEWRWVVTFSATVLGFITTSMLHPPPACMRTSYTQHLAIPEG